MVIIQVAGGLGNQMQQYALYRKFLTMGIDTKLDISWFTGKDRQDGVYAKRRLELDYFRQLHYAACTEDEKAGLTGNGSLADKLKRKFLPGADQVFCETQMYHPEIFECRDKYLIGYWACEKYYADIMDVLQKEIRFPVSTDARNEELAARMKGEESVAVHIRRGDYLDVENQKMFGNICTQEYYDGAVREIKRVYPAAHFYVFSDDEAFIKTNYQTKEYTTVDWNKGECSFYDMWLMSKCRHNICANSTFSFWGARLNANPEKIVIRPSIHKNSQICEPKRMHELWKGWVLVNNKGNVV